MHERQMTRLGFAALSIGVALSCSMPDKAFAPRQAAGAAQLALNMNVHAGSRASQILLSVAYISGDTGNVVGDTAKGPCDQLECVTSLGDTLIDLPLKAPVSIRADLGRCLAANPPPLEAHAANACPVRILALLLAGRHTLSGHDLTSLARTVADSDLLDQIHPGPFAGGPGASLTASIDLREVSSIVLSQTAVTVSAGQHVRLTSRVLDAAGNTLVDALGKTIDGIDHDTWHVHWVSANPNIAGATDDGDIFGANPGSTTVVVSAGGHSAILPVTVTPPPSIITSTDTVKLSMTQGSAGIVSGTVAITSSLAAGGTQIDVAQSPISFGSGASGWASASLTPSRTPSTLTVTTTGVASTLAAGTYTGTLSINSSTNPVVRPHLIFVRLTVSSSFTITVNKTGSGTGNVTANPAGPSYAPGTVVTLTAAPATGSTFAGFSGDCTSTATSCTVTMNSNKSVTATFNAQTSFTGTTNASFTAVRSGTGACSWSITGPMRLDMTVNQGAGGSVTGSAHLTGTFTVTGLSSGCTSEVDPADATFSLSGTTSNITFSGVALGVNDGTSNFINGSFSGSLSGGAVTGTLTFSYAGPNASGSGGSTITLR